MFCKALNFNVVIILIKMSVSQMYVAGQQLFSVLSPHCYILIVTEE